MARQADGSRWLSWSLEQVALILGGRFPDRHVWVVRASHMYLHKFTCYRNFVESNMFGAPEHSPYAPDYGAFCHLRLVSVCVFTDQLDTNTQADLCYSEYLHIIALAGLLYQCLTTGWQQRQTFKQPLILIHVKFICNNTHNICLVCFKCVLIYIIFKLKILGPWIHPSPIVYHLCFLFFSLLFTVFLCTWNFSVISLRIFLTFYMFLPFCLLNGAAFPYWDQ